MGRTMSELQLDELTGVLSHRALSRGIEPGVFAVLVDVDGLTWVNDQGGHINGDRALVLVADALSHLVPRNVFRVGGDEFLLILPAANLEAALSVATQAVEGVRALGIPYRRIDQPSCVRLEVNAVVFQLNADVLSLGMGSTGMTQELRGWFGELISDLKAGQGNRAGVVVDAHARRWLPPRR
jgi:diguanylate cyclase (GGDEF)-like protein